MKILIVEDNKENMKAAEEAVKKFKLHDFEFSLFAKTAFKKIEEVEGVITDLFFKEEKIADYDKFVSVVEKARNTKTIRNMLEEKYYNNKSYCGEVLNDGDYRIAKKIDAAFDKAIMLLKNGTHREEFALGGCLMIKAKQLEIKSCLVSTIHHHSCNMGEESAFGDGVIILIPLIEAGIITVDDATGDGYLSNNYIGGDTVCSLGKKNNPKTWEKAIERLIKQ